MYLSTPLPTPEILHLFNSDQSQRGHVMNLTRLWAWRPEVFEGFAALRTSLTGSSTLSSRELAVIVCATAARLGDAYCALAWGKLLADASNPAVASRVLLEARGSDGAEVSNTGSPVSDSAMTARDQALAIWTGKVIRDPNSTTQSDVTQLRDAGFTDQEIFEATTFIAFRLAFSTVNDALGVRPDWQVAAAAPPEVRRAVTFGRPVAEPALLDA